MKTLQLSGLIFSTTGLSLVYLLLAHIDPQTPASAASALGIGLVFVALPVLGAASLMLIPSSLALITVTARRKAKFTGRFWLSIWALNSCLSVLFLLIAVYVAFTYLTVISGR